MRSSRKYFPEKTPDLPILNEPPRYDNLNSVFGYIGEIQLVVRFFGMEERLAEMNFGVVFHQDAMVRSEPGINEFEITEKARSS